MLILAFDTTAAACSVALWRDGIVLQSASAVMEQGQAEALMPMIETVMATANTPYTALDRIAVTIGPGSFTGVRVGLSAARGIAMAADKPVIGVTSLEVLAYAVPDSELPNGPGILVAVDARRGDFFLQKFKADRTPAGEITSLLPEAVAAWAGAGPWIIAGDGAVTIAPVIHARVSTASPRPDTTALAALAAVRVPQIGGPLPLYIHAPSVTMPS